MKVLVIGSGGREHAIVWKIKQDPQLGQLFCAPGNAGTAELAQNVPIGAEDLEGLLDFAVSQQIELTLVGPEVPLAAGIVDRFQQVGLSIAGPSRAAAQLESSKAFAKDFMKRHAIPTAGYESFDQLELAETALKSDRFQFPVVLKADGLAAGKGVFICSDRNLSLEALNWIMGERRFGASGDRVVIEEFLEGKEVSFMVFSDGVNILPMVPSQDHKAIYEGDRGPNTGGMGAYSTDAILSEELRGRILDEIIYPTLRGMSEEGNPYRGILYAGLMINSEGPKVLEFNVRFGDPETQVVLPRLESDLLAILYATASDSLRDVKISWNQNAAVCVVMVAKGYPGSYDKGQEISGLEMVSEDENTIAFHAGTALKDGKFLTNGGRVVGVTSVAPTLEAAIIRAYEGVNKIYFEGMFCKPWVFGSMSLFS